MKNIDIQYTFSMTICRKEYQRKYHQNIDIQSEIEQPEIHMLALGSPKRNSDHDKTSVEDSSMDMPDHKRTLLLMFR